MSYRLFNVTDGVYADPRSFITLDEVACAKEEFVKRFKLQGYYKTADGLRIPPEDVTLEVMSSNVRDVEPDVEEEF